MIVTDYNYVGSERRRSVVSLRRRTTDHEVACVCEVCVYVFSVGVVWCGVVWCTSAVPISSSSYHIDLGRCLLCVAQLRLLLLLLLAAVQQVTSATPLMFHDTCYWASACSLTGGRPAGRAVYDACPQH